MSEDPSPVTFETALEKLEKLVESLEKGDVPLSGLVEKFEEGSRLIKICQTRLEEAELRIENLRGDSAVVSGGDDRGAES